MSGKKRTKTHIPSDFKHRKAKVGKRAPQQANLTNTSFKAVSVQLQGQSIAKVGSGGDNVVSSRGKSIGELTNQLHHPAGAVRISAIRGLTNVIQVTSFDVLETHLSTLLPVIAKCACVDQEGDVRTLGLGALRELARNEGELWKPFIPLLTAFCTSALNSLDRGTRLDGSRAVEIISNLPLDRKTVSIILPAYITLLQDHSQNSNRETPFEDGKKKKKNATENKRLVVLQSLVALLRSIDEKVDESAPTGSLETDLIVSSSCQSTSSFVLTASDVSHPVQAMYSLETLASMYDDEPNSDPLQRIDIKDSIVVDLFSKMRDVFVEVTQGEALGHSRGLSVGLSGMEELSQLVIAIHLLWKLFARSLKSSVVTHLITLMLDSTPIHSRAQDQVERYESLNGNLCSAVIEIGAELLKDNTSTDTILDYLLPRLDARNINQSMITMNVIWGLMHLRDQEGQFTLGGETRDTVLQRISEVYFLNGELDQDSARSAGGRTAVRLSISLLKEDAYVIRSDSLRQTVECLPKYLVAWGGDFPLESGELVDTLHNLFRRISFSNDTEANMKHCHAQRIGLSRIFVSKKKGDTTFERYPLFLQRQILCLVVTLGSPHDDLLKGLGRICSRAGEDIGISHDLADYILNVMHATRRTLSMKSYLGFIMSTIGVPKSSVVDVKGEWITVCDKATLRASIALRRCGATTKILPLIAPMIQVWLKISGVEGLVRFRVALLLLAIFAQEVDILEGASQLRLTMLDSMLCFFNLCSWENEKSELFISFLKPMTALFEAHPPFLKDVVVESAVRLHGDVEGVSRLVKAIHELSRKSSLAKPIREHKDSWIESARQIVACVKDRPDEQEAEMMLTNLGLVVGI